MIEVIRGINNFLTYVGIGFLLAVVFNQDFSLAVSEFAKVIAHDLGPVTASYLVFGLTAVFFISRFAETAFSIYQAWSRKR